MLGINKYLNNINYFVGQNSMAKRSFYLPSWNDVYMILLRNWSTCLSVDILFWNKEKQQNTLTYQLKINYGCA